MLALILGDENFQVAVSNYLIGTVDVFVNTERASVALNVLKTKPNCALVCLQCMHSETDIFLMIADRARADVVPRVLLVHRQDLNAEWAHQSRSLLYCDAGSPDPTQVRSLKEFHATPKSQPGCIRVANSRPRKISIVGPDAPEKIVNALKDHGHDLTRHEKFDGSGPNSADAVIFYVDRAQKGSFEAGMETARECRMAMPRQMPCFVILSEDHLDERLRLYSQGATWVFPSVLSISSILAIDFMIERMSKGADDKSESAAARLLPDHSTTFWNIIPALMLRGFDENFDAASHQGGHIDEDDDEVDELTLSNVYPYECSASGDGEQFLGKETSLGIITKIGDYDVEAVLSEHAHGCTYECTGEYEDDDFIIKSFTKRSVFRSCVVSSLMTTLAALVKVDGNANICELIEVIHDHRQVSLVQRVAAKGKLSERLAREGSMELANIKVIFRQLVCAVELLQTAHKIAHGFLSPKVVFLDDDENVKLSGFGYSHKVLGSDKKPWREKVSRIYSSVSFNVWVAPECWCGAYDAAKVDIWSLGLILLYMLHGGGDVFKQLESTTPACSGGVRVFMNKSVQSYKDSMQEIISDVVEKSAISPLLEDMLRNMLIFDPRKRMSMDEILLHRWMGSEDVPAFAIVSRQRSKAFSSSSSACSVSVPIKRSSSSNLLARRKAGSHSRLSVDVEHSAAEDFIGVPLTSPQTGTPKHEWSFYSIEEKSGPAAVYKVEGECNSDPDVVRKRRASKEDQQPQLAHQSGEAAYIPAASARKLQCRCAVL